MASTPDRAEAATDTPSLTRTGRAKARVDAARHQVDTARSTVPTVDAAFVAYEHDKRIGGNLLACAVAYRLFLWLLPLSLLVAALLGFLNDAGGNVPADTAKELGLGAYVTSTVVTASSQASKSRWVILVIALFGLYSASAAGAKTFRAVYGLVWGVMLARPRRAGLPAVAFAGFALAVGGLTVGANWVRHQSGPLGLAVRIGMLGVFFLFALAAMLMLPHPDVPWLRLVPGAALIAVGTQLLHLFTVLYLANKLSSQSQLYGGLGAAATVLLWLYLVGRLVVGAAVLNASLWERSQRK